MADSPETAVPVSVRTKKDSEMMSLTDFHSGKDDVEASSHLLEDNPSVQVRPFGTSKKTLDPDFCGRNISKSKSFSKGNKYQDKYLLLLGGIIVVLIITIIIISVKLTFEDSSSEKSQTSLYILVDVQCGEVEGKIEDGGYAFRGIPYAASPTGLLRWRPTKTLQDVGECWRGVYEAHDHKPVCYQQPVSKHLPQMSEDCLFLDIYTPDITYRDPMPVLVYFAGDSFIDYDDITAKLRPSTRISVANSVVIVHVNYRINVFGFLALDIFHEPDYDASGNYGLHDMITALKWIQTNIDTFGGDSRRVTVLGHGSSATAVRALISSPLAHRLFSNVWITGGAADILNRSLEEVENDNSPFLKSTDCNSRSCLVYKLSDEIIDANPWFYEPFGGYENFHNLPIKGEKISAIPVVDGIVIPDLPSKTWPTGISMVVGASAHAQLYEPYSEFWNGTQEMINVQHRLSTFDLNLADNILKYYSAGDQLTYDEYQKMVADVRIVCPLLKMALAVNSSIDDIYSYILNYLPQGDLKELTASKSIQNFDIISIFDQVDEFFPDASSQDKKFAKEISDIFYMYVHDGWLQSADINQSSVLTPVPSPPGYLEFTQGKILQRSEPYHNCKLWHDINFDSMYGRQN